VKGIAYGHAWVEVDALDVAIDLNGMIPAETVYRVGKARDVQRYTLYEADELAQDTGRCGPWTDAHERLNNLIELVVTRRKAA
jgi:hypothetical protein